MAATVRYHLRAHRGGYRIERMIPDPANPGLWTYDGRVADGRGFDTAEHARGYLREYGDTPHPA